MDARERERVIEKYERVLSIGVRVKSLLLSNTNSRNDDDDDDEEARDDDEEYFEIIPKARVREREREELSSPQLTFTDRKNELNGTWVTTSRVAKDVVALDSRLRRARPRNEVLDEEVRNVRDLLEKFKQSNNNCSTVDSFSCEDDFVEKKAIARRRNERRPGAEYAVSSSSWRPKGADYWRTPVEQLVLPGDDDDGSISNGFPTADALRRAGIL